VAEEVGVLLEADGASVVRYAGDGEVERLAAWTAPGHDPPPRGGVEPEGISVTAPVIVDGRPWGAMLAWSRASSAVPDAAAARLADFTELVATAISNTASRRELARLAEEQAALRRVATLVARESSPAEVLAGVAEELGRLLGVDDVKLYR
jgi:hypothetical protein